MLRNEMHSASFRRKDRRGVPQERLYRTEGIVLRELDYAETDRILTLLTPEGKLSALVHGIRRSTSRKVGHLGLFYRAQLLMARGRNLDIITQAESIEEFEGLRGDLMRFTYACYIGELVQHLSHEEEGGDLYALTVDALRRIADEPDPRLWTRYFELRLLRYTGYQPELFRCLGCQEPIRPEANVFVASEGGLFCPRCGATQSRGRAVSVNAQKVLRYLTTRGPEDVQGLRISEGTHAEVEALLYEYLEYTLERELKSVAFLQRLRRELRESAASRRPAEEP
jgi:DNA repair protein RecO (recombination protein O)